jgi:hypothetical protein
MGSAPIGNTGGIEYAIEVYASGAGFGPSGTAFMEIPDALNLGYSRYDRLPGKAFFTVPQSSPLVGLLGSLPGLPPVVHHVGIWRISTSGATLVFRGILMDWDAVGDDVIFDCYDYLSLLSLSRSGFKTMYPNKKLGTEIVAPEWAAAVAVGDSPIAFVTTGTIENPLMDDELTEIKTNAQFGTLDQARLQLFFDLSEIGRANTEHRVTYEITLANVFNFWKHQTGTAPFELTLNGTVSDYHFAPGWTHYRNDIATIGVGSAGGPSEITVVGTTNILGRRQDVTTLKTLAGIAGGGTESDQQKAALDRALNKLSHYPGNLSVRLERGAISPTQVRMNDLTPVEISNGRDLIRRDTRIVGERVFYDEGGEDVDILVDFDIGIFGEGGGG